MKELWIVLIVSWVGSIVGLSTGVITMITTTMIGAVGCNSVLKAWKQRRYFELTPYVPLIQTLLICWLGDLGIELCMAWGFIELTEILGEMIVMLYSLTVLLYNANTSILAQLSSLVYTLLSRFDMANLLTFLRSMLTTSSSVQGTRRLTSAPSSVQGTPPLTGTPLAVPL